MDKDATRERLEQERRIVEQEIERLKRAIQAETEFEPEDSAPDLIEREKSVALLQSFEARLREILDALETVEQGTYGICERCGRPIDPERLNIMPETRLCVRCKAETEQRYRRRFL
ncbi:MAG: TraR/DksA C4-type zinc finger protein [Ardenticatenia bacterium]|nr:TraR/DksA C4-type zinc finger protein [Ardenticatenia bacterium]